MLAAVDAFVVLTERAGGDRCGERRPPAKIVVNRLGIHEHKAPRRRRLARERDAIGARVRVGYVGRFEDVKGVL